MSFDKDYLFKLLDRNGLCNNDSDIKSKIEKLTVFGEYLLTENEKFNLTAIKTPQAVMLRHFCDCITILPYIPKNARFADVGSGAGFPAIPAAIMRPDINVYAIEATAKKAAFIENAAKMLTLSNLSVIVGRAEELAVKQGLRERFEAVSARAVAPVSILVEICAPFLRVGGVFIAMKGDKDSAQAELAAAKYREILGLSCGATVDVSLNDDIEQLNRTLIVMNKISPTPKEFPRRYAQIVKG